jgi:hypothetical protein
MNNKQIKLTIDRNGIIGIERHGQPMQCPWRSPFPVPGQLAGQVGIASSPCNSLCPFFYYDEPAKEVRLNCIHPAGTIEISAPGLPF